MFGRKKRIRIEFYDAETGRMIGFDEKRPQQIPPTFRFETLVEIRGKTWKLVEAEPFERRKFLRSGLLTIKLSLVESNGEQQDLPGTPAEEKLYRNASRPSVFPGSANRPRGKSLELFRGDWRQIELVSSRLRSEISREMGRIQSIRQSASVEQDGRLFFREQHVRDLPDDILRIDELTPSDLGKSWFPFANFFDGIAFAGKEAAANVYAMRLPAGISMYGSVLRGRIVSIGMLPPEEKHQLIGLQDIQRLVEFMETHSLVLVDWENLRFLEPILPALAAYFSIATEAPAGESPASGLETGPDPESDLLFTANPDPVPSLDPGPPGDEDLTDMRIDHSLEGGLGEEE